MQSEWKQFKLIDLITVKHGFAFKGKHIVTDETNNIVLTPGNFKVGGGFKSDKFKYYDSDDFPESYILIEDDLLISMTDLSKAGDTLGFPAKIPSRINNEKYLHNQRLGLVGIISDNIDKDYLYWLLRTRWYQKFIVNSSTGSTVKHTSPSRILEYEFTAPSSVSEQKKIAHILSTLDDKIELNRKMNQTLEEMAQALFKSWFVDFDPVHLKAKSAVRNEEVPLGHTSEEELEAGVKELGLSKEVLELFPSEFVESEMGMIPEGWEGKPLDQIAHYQNGLALQKFRPKNEEEFLPVLKIAQLKKGYADGEEKADINIKPSCIVDDGDVVFSWSGSLVVDVWCGGKVALNQHLFKVTSDEYAKWFYYYWTKQHLMNFQRVAAAKAVTMGHIKRSHLAEALCVVPDGIIFKMAETMINPLLEKLILNRLEINDLQKTRDTLLPKLLSGELDVSEVEI